MNNPVEEVAKSRIKPVACPRLKGLIYTLDGVRQKQLELGSARVNIMVIVIVIPITRLLGIVR